MARPLYCSVDPEKYHPVSTETRWDMGYLGTYSADRQPALDALLLEPARQWRRGRFAVVGPKYPESLRWPANVERTIHLSPREHASFYAAQSFTLNITREAMKQAGYSPSVRLFEAAACGVPVISDWWEGLDSVFRIGKEVLIAESTEDALRILHDLPDAERRSIALAARRRVLMEHTSEQRALQLESYLKEMDDNLSLSATRRLGCDRKNSDRMEKGFPSERERQETGAKVGGKVVAIADSSRLHKPSGASFGNR
jgi:spore maturation protein CgeB